MNQYILKMMPASRFSHKIGVGNTKSIDFKWLKCQIKLSKELIYEISSKIPSAYSPRNYLYVLLK